MSTPPPKDHRDLLKRALLKIDNLQAQLDKQQEPIAIIGMSLRFPNGANGPEKFWQILREGVDCITEIPASRWNVDDYYDPNPDAPGKMYTRCAGFIDNVEHFDPQFFGIAPREAQSMDPQQRLLLEVAWEALERAGQSPSKLIGSRTGVYIGISGNDYAHLHTGAESIDTYFGAGVAHSIAAGRISYVLGLQGPSVAVDTACSASLTAVHLACQSLRNGESDVALAGGVNVILTPEGIITASQARMLSPEGRCKTFDASANGYVRAEGCAMIVLKRLSDARANGDNILALIRGTAANQDGRSGGLTAPNGEAQQVVIRAALANAQLKPEEISYLETHGTGTALGDPIEVQAIGEVFRASHSKEKPLFIGAVKSNIGHLEAAAGIAGLIKTVLALQHGELPPSLHVRKLNPHIAWEKLPVQVTTELMPWKSANVKRIAGVSSFGFSGTNVHVVLQGANEDKKEKEPSSGEENALRVLTLSAKNDAALRELAARYECHLTHHNDTPLNPPSRGDLNNSPLEGGVGCVEANTLANICFTANAGRAHFNHRIALLADSAEQARAELLAFVNGETSSRLQHGVIEDGRRDEVAFLFTGQGAQYRDMGKRLYETQPVFRAALNKCDELLRPYLEVPLLEVMFNNRESAPALKPVILEGPSLELETTPSAREASSRMITQGGVSSGQSSVISNQPSLNTDHLLDQTAYTQPVLFALEYALAELWRSWGIIPSYVMGHSVGEYVAACVAGVFSLEDGLKLIAARARLMQALPQNGTMAVVFANEATVRTAINSYRDRVDIAASNGPTNIVLSGEREALQEILNTLERAGIKHKLLTVSHAFHSPLMEPMLEAFERIAREVQYHAPRIPLVSNLTGKFVADDEITNALYWRKHVRAAVRFSEAMRTLHEHGCKIFVELGPSPTLLSMGQRCLPENSAAWLPSLRNGRDDKQQVLETLAGLYVNGANVDWDRVYRDDARQRVVLPTYPFQRQRYWATAAEKRVKIDDRELRMADSRSLILHPQSSTLHPLLGARLRSALKEIQFETKLDLQTQPFLREHQFNGTPIFPAAAYVEMALAAAREVYGNGTHVIEQFALHEALLLNEEEKRLVQLILSPESETQSAFQIFSARTNEGATQTQWTLHAGGKLRTGDEQEASRADLAALRNLCTRALDAQSYYEKCRDAGVELGPRFQILTQPLAGEGQALAEIKRDAEEAEHYRISPFALAACLQLCAALKQEGEDEAHVYLPMSFERMHVYRDRLSAIRCHVVLRERTHAEAWSCDLTLYDDAGYCCARIENAQYRRWQHTKIDDWFYQIQWQSQALTAAEEKSLAGEKWLLCADQLGFAAEVAARLRERNVSAICVYAGESFVRLNENAWRIDPARGEDFDRLLQEIGTLHGMIHCWSLDAHGDDSSAAPGILAAEKLLCGSVLHLTQASLRAKDSNAPQLWLLTRGAQAVGDDDALQLQPVQTSLWGLANVIALEHPALQCRRIDLAPTMNAMEAARRVLKEISANTRETQIALRNDQRYVARVMPLTTTSNEQRATSIQQQATYLITGGLGALGLHVAQWLAEAGARHIVLVGRRKPSPSAQAVINEMEKTGARIVCAAIDISREEEARGLLDDITRTLPSLRGIIHSAGVLDDGVLVQQDWSRFERVMAPKILGAWHLHRLTKDLPLDFFALFSSIASMFGAASQSNYAAANAFMDGLAHYRRGQGLPAISINWGPWAEGGMVTEQGARTAQRLAQQGLRLIDPEQGMQALQSLLTGPHTQVGVLPVRWQKFLAQYQPSEAPTLFAHMALEILPKEKHTQVVHEDSFTKKLENALPSERHELLTAHVREQVVQVLGLDAAQTPALQQGLTALGMDSLMAVELSNRLRASLGRALPATLAFEYPSIAALTQYLATEILQWEGSAKAKAKSDDTQNGKAHMQQEIEQIAEGELEDSLLQELKEAGY